MARMVCVWLPNWPVQRLRHERPELRDRPVVLFSNTGNRGPRVAATDSPVGLTIGMPLAEAEALLAGQAGTAAHIEPHDPAADLAGLRELARTCETFSPLFGIEEAESPECVLLDVTGCEHLFASRSPVAPRQESRTTSDVQPLTDHGRANSSWPLSHSAVLSRSDRATLGEHNLVEAITDDFQQRGFQVRVALAPTIGAAWALAHHRSPTPCGSVDCQFDSNRPGHKGLGYETLAPLPVTALRLPPKIIETLHELGLRRIGQLRALPRETLPSRFGAELLKRLDQAFGDEPELLVPERPLEPVATVWVTDEPLTDRESLKFVSGQLLEKLLGQLKPRREGVRQLFCQIKGAAARPVEFVVNLISPCDLAKHLLELLSLQIERADLPEGISFVRLEATSVASLATRQRDLFGFETDSDTHREVSSLLDRLSNRLGATAVVRAVPVPDAQPELSVRHEPCVCRSTLAGNTSFDVALFRDSAPKGQPHASPGQRPGDGATRESEALKGRHSLTDPASVAPSGLSNSGHSQTQGGAPVGRLPWANFGLPLRGETTNDTTSNSVSEGSSMMLATNPSLALRASLQSRPLHLLAPPQRIEATAAGPEGAPMHFRWDRREHRVIRSWGPERIETGWWREQSICRDYFRVETQTGQHFWLFRCFDQAAWFLHGAFD